MEGYPVVGVNVSLLELQVGNVKPAAVSSGEYQRHCSLEVNLSWIIRYRLVILFYFFLGGSYQHHRRIKNFAGSLKSVPKIPAVASRGDALSSKVAGCGGGEDGDASKPPWLPPLRFLQTKARTDPVGDQ
ncbi:hypothetical protein SAY87_011944 [Trapa incisa]|uniref:Uncharacterized protein n=1 Tax=Trapa incisa TaxID=236973 RepID=A0AAN7H094_9MYRT|nr:hypothetical protein SAY87_011944 [Trapa incisa]